MSLSSRVMSGFILISLGSVLAFDINKDESKALLNLTNIGCDFFYCWYLPSLRVSLMDSRFMLLSTFVIILVTLL